MATQSAIGRIAKLWVVSVLLALAAACASPQAALSVSGTEFVLRHDDEELRSADLVGATLAIDHGGESLPVTIESVTLDDEAIGGRVFLHRFMIDSDAGPVPLCTPDAQGRQLGFPVPDGRGGYTITCTSGAIGKCVRWGYRFWEERAGGPPLRDLHRACVAMTRADYGGDGEAHTRPGVPIYLCDQFGILPCEADAPLTFEAAWNDKGAVCVARPRVTDIITLADIAARYPHLNGKLGKACTATARDALLFSRS